MSDSSVNSIMQAALSHYIAERDRALALLDINLNNPPGTMTPGGLTEAVILWFKKLNEAQGTIELITEIIEGNKKERLNILEQFDKAKEAFEKQHPIQPPTQIIKEGEDPINS